MAKSILNKTLTVYSALFAMGATGLTANSGLIANVGSANGNLVLTHAGMVQLQCAVALAFLSGLLRLWTSVLDE